MDQIKRASLGSFACDEQSAAHTLKVKADLSARLNRAEGQIRGIKKMIEKNDYCDEVINQIFAASSALEAVSKLLLKSHIEGWVVDKIKNGDPEIVEELLVTIGKMQ